MAKTSSKFVCQQCGYESVKWMGRCPDCGEWNSMVETVSPATRPSADSRKSGIGRAGQAAPIPLSQVQTLSESRRATGSLELDRVLGGGLVPGSLILLGGEPGIGKCVTGDTRVLDPETGAFLPVTEWAQASRSVLALDEATYHLSSRAPSAFHDQGTQPIVQVTTRLGRTLRCTPSHPALTPDGWRAVGDLPAGARIASPRALPYFGADRMPEQAVKLIAYILSDGSATTQLSVTSMLPQVADDLHEIAPSLDELHRLAEAAGILPEVLELEAHAVAGLVTPASRLLEQVNVRFLKARTKRVPDRIYQLPKEQLAIFLRTLFTCDGSMYVNRRGQAGVSYSTISHGLAQDVQHLLLRFGFITRLRTKPMMINGEPYIAHEIQLLGLPHVKRFLAEIGIWGREAAKARSEQCVAPILPSTQLDTIPTGALFWSHVQNLAGNITYKAMSRTSGVTLRKSRLDGPLARTTVATLAGTYQSSYLHRLAHGDVYWDEIVSVTPAGEERVYDLTVPGAANFVANDLVVHNSTLAAQVAGHMALHSGEALYVSAEESAQQVKLRAERLGIQTDQLLLLAETDVDAVVETIERMAPALVVVDSIQTVSSAQIASAPGSVSQVRESTLRLMQIAKRIHVPICIIGHVTKEGTVAGPRTLEHMVDVVLYLEGERFHAYRLLRGVKNRFGATSEVGVFEMSGDGMLDVSNPSGLFLTERRGQASGSAVVVSMEGTRPLLVEVQALATTTAFGVPRVTTNGVDRNRLLMLMAVLTKRVGMSLGNQDVYVNVAGGFTLDEPAVDLGVAIAVASSFTERRVSPNTVLLGEIGLGGELRPVTRMGARVREAEKLGFERCIVPAASEGIDRETTGGSAPRIETLTAATVKDAIELALQ